MAIFWNVFIRTIAIFASILTTIILISLLLRFFENENQSFTLVSGDANSSNIIAIYELNGLIVESGRQFSNLTNQFVISPSNTKKILKNINNISPKIIIFSINSPGGTVSASKSLFDIIKNYKKNNNDIQIIFHTNELLASGGYWVATSADEIYANYGSIIGSIGVKGPDWFFYDKPIKISTGIFGNTIETQNGIDVFTSKAGKSKDIFNSFRRPEKFEIDHLQNMVNEIYDDFVRIVSQERKIETKTLLSEIGALIFTSKEAADIFLIDEVLSLDDLVEKKVKENNLEDYKVIKITESKNSILKELITSYFNTQNRFMELECINLRSSISVILSYEATGC
tara:strand:- start:2376 stop:3398 length:1023 start_codon:yes stop_codon:yes gene_type:complete